MLRFSAESSRVVSTATIERRLRLISWDEYLANDKWYFDPANRSRFARCVRSQAYASNRESAFSSTIVRGRLVNDDRPTILSEFLRRALKY